jgi:hypothetical protein
MLHMRQCIDKDVELTAETGLHTRNTDFCLPPRFHTVPGARAVMASSSAIKRRDIKRTTYLYLVWRLTMRTCTPPLVFVVRCFNKHCALPSWPDIYKNLEFYHFH